MLFFFIKPSNKNCPPNFVAFISNLQCMLETFSEKESLNLIVRYDELALNVAPSANLVGVGSRVLFPQGNYKIESTEKMA